MLPETIKVLVPDFTSLPVPEIVLANVKLSAPLKVTALPTLSVPTEILLVLKVMLLTAVKLPALMVPAKVVEVVLLTSPIVALLVCRFTDPNPEILPAVNVPVLTVKLSFELDPEMEPVTVVVALGLVIMTSELSTTFPVR